MYATSDILATTLKGPYHLGASFFVMYGRFRFVPSSQTLSPILKGLKLLSFTSLCCAFLIASCASRWCCFNCSILLASPGSVVGRSGWCMHGVYPSISSYGVFLVVLLTQEFLTYWASGIHLAQSFWSLLVTVRRNCSIVWFVLSLCPSVCRWFAELIFCLIWKILQISLVTFARNQGSLSEMTFVGIL